MNGHLKRVLILLLIFTFVFQMAGVTSLSRVQAYAETEEAVLDISDAEDTEDMTAEEIDTESPGESETDGENPPDEAAEPAAPEAASEEPAEVPEAAPADETITVEEPAEEAAEEPAPAKAPVLKAATKAEKTGTVLAFTSDTHNRSDNAAAIRLGTWIKNVKSIHGDIDVMAFGGDMAQAGASTSSYWDFTQADMDKIKDAGITGVYTTGNHEISSGGDFSYSTYTSGSYSSTETKGQFEIDKEVEVGNDYRIYCLGSRGGSESNPGYSDDQISALRDYLKDAGNDKVIFIITHFPLHYFSNFMSRTTTGASDVIDTLNNAVTNNGQTIVFLWGHNHTLSDTYYDEIYGPGGNKTIEYARGYRKEIEFYYGGAGCMSDEENGNPSAFVKGKGLVATITQNRGNATLEFTYYGLPSDNGVVDVTESTSIRSVAVTLGEAAGGDTGTTYTLTDKLEAGKEYLIASGNSGDVLLLSNESTGTAKQLKGINATVSDGKITIDDAVLDKVLFACEADSSSTVGGMQLKSGDNYLYSSSNDGLSMHSKDALRCWHYKAYDGDTDRHILWLIKESNGADGWTSAGNTYKYYLDYSSGTYFTDKHLGNGDTIQAATNLPKIYLFTKDDGSGGDDPTPVTTETRYVETNTLVSGSKYIIAATKDSGTVYAIRNAATGTSSTNTDSVELGLVSSGAEAAYILNPASNVVWTYDNDSHMTNSLNNTTFYLYYYTNNNNRPRATTTSANANPISLTTSGKLKLNNRFLTCSSGTFGTTSTESSGVDVRLFVETEVPISTDPVAVEDVAINPSTASISIGGSIQLNPVFTPSNATNKNVTWNSSNNTVATVDTQGKVTGVSAGTATMTVTTEDGSYTANATITVTESKSYVIVIGDYALSTDTTDDELVNSGSGTQRFNYTGLAGVTYSSGETAANNIRWHVIETTGGYYIKSLDGRYLNATYETNETGGSTGTLKLDNTPDVWTISGSLENWTINGSTLKSTNANKSLTHEETSGSTAINLFTIRSTGETTVLEEASDPVAVTGVSLDKSSAEIKERKTVQLNATTTPANATNKNVTWTSSNETVATVDENGLVTGKLAGTATITVKTEDGNYTATCTITVTKGDPVQTYIIVIDGYALKAESSNDTLTNSNTYHYTGLTGVVYNDNTEITDDILWIITETSGGYFIQSAKDNKYLNATYVTTTNPTGAQGDLKLDDTQDVWVIEGTLDDWQVEGSKLKSSNANKSLTHEETSGTTTINLFTVRSTGEDSYIIDPDTDPVAVNGVTLDRSEFAITVGDTETLTANVSPNNASNKEVTWSSSNEAVATVTDGVVTGVSAGTATITVTTVDGGKTATATVTVTAAEGKEYVLTDTLTAGKDYIIASSNTVGTTYILGHDEDNAATRTATIESKDGKLTISTSRSDVAFTSAAITGGVSLTNGGYYITVEGSGALTFATASSTKYWAYSNNKLSSVSSSATRYLTFSGNEFKGYYSSSNPDPSNIYLFVEKGDEPDDPQPEAGDKYKLVDSFTSGKQYLIVSANAAGSAYALKNPGGTDAGVKPESSAIIIRTGDIDNDGTNDTYIATEATDIIWYATTNSTGFDLTNNNDYFEYKSGAINIFDHHVTPARFWEYNDSQLQVDINGSYYNVYFDGASVKQGTESNSRLAYIFEKVTEEQHTHTYGEPTWTWAEGNTSATATFTCTEGDDTQTVTDSAPVETVVTAAGCETNKVVKYTATVTFNGEQYTNDTDNITVPNSALGHAYGEPTWTWDGFTAATAKFTCANDASHTQTVNATITSAAQGGVTTYTATAAFEGQTYTDQKADTSMLITEASATFTYPIVGDDVTMGRNATVPEGANYSVNVYEYRDENGTKLTTGTFEAGKTYYAEYAFNADPGYGFKGGAADTSGQVPALGDRVALTINGSDATSLIDAAYTYSRVLVYVQFTPENPEFNLTISNYGVSGADGTATLSATIAHRGDEITVTATPAAGSAFEYAEYKKAGSQENPTRINNGKFNMPPYDVEVTAVFTKAKYTIAVTSNNEAYGTASISEPQSWYNMGDEVTLTATAKDGYEFSRWNVISGGVNIANDKFTVGTENVEIQAVFAPKNYSLKFYANEGDTDTYAVVTKAFGDTITEADLPAAPTKAFYTFNGWTPEIPATMPAEDKTFTATWTAKEAYYLVGSMNNWTVSETYEFVASPQNPGEYTVAATLTANDEIKVVKAVAGVKDESNYYPSTEHPGASGQTGNYIVDQYHAGGVTVYFRPAGNTDEGWQDFGGYFYIEGDHAVTVETSPANSGTAQVVRGDGSEAAKSAPKGMSLTVNATPADNYQLDKIEIWKTNGGTEAEETLEGNTFNMPDYDVTVKVYFKVVNWTFVDFTWEQTIDGYKAVANYTGDDESTKTVNATVTAETTAATCEEAGETVYTATIAAGVSLDGEAHNATKTVVIPAAGHTYGDLIAEVPATCTTDGVKAHYECSVCHKLFNADKTETTAEALKIAATGHDWSYKNFTWTGDEETGYTAATVHYVCRNDADHTRAINVTVTSETNAPTCENAGSTVYTATVAAADSPDGIGHTDTRTVVIPATEHSWKFVNFTWTGNDEEGYTAAVANYKCENDEEHTQTVNATVTSETTAASCEVAGSTVYTATVAAADSLDGKVCTDTKTVEIPATGHKWVKPAEWTWIGDDENGYTGIRGTFTCENDPEHTREVQSTEEVTVKRVEPTATQAGSITYTVNATGPNGVVYEVEKEIIIPPAGYTFKDPVYIWTKTTDGYSVAALKECNEDPAQNITETVTATYAVTTPATCEDDGVGTYTAAFTKSDFTTQTKPEDIPATGHTPVTDAAVAPTCTETGLTEGSHCSVCGDILTAQETVPALGHDWRQPTGVWNSDHTSVVLTFVCNRDTSHTETVTASGSAITSEVTTEPTATTPGVRTYTATVTFDGKTYTLSDTEVIPVTGSSVSGNITSFVGNNAEGQVTVQLFAAGSETAAYTATVTGNTSYAFAGVANGTYTMKVSKKDHATRSYEITVAGGAVTQDVKIHLLGDINGDGDITTVDAARVNAHAKGSTLLTDYNFACGDINGDGDITTVDAARTNAHAKGATLIW